MRRITLSLFVLLALMLAACAPAATEQPTQSVPVTGDTATPMDIETDTPAASLTPETPMESPTAAVTEPATTGMTISISSSPSAAEPFLVDDQGRSLYVFTNDTQNSSTSACTGDCLMEWPPVVVTGAVNAGEGVDAAMLGTIAREDGTMQATYNGWPLYYYSGDVAAGDTLGQGMDGLWYLVSAMGTAIQP